MAFYVLFALLALCTGQTVSPTTSPSPTQTPSCSASPGYFCSGGSSLICPIGAYCTGGAAQNVSCYPVTACTVAGLSAQPPCYWNVSTLAGSGICGYADGKGAAAQFRSLYGVAYYNGSVFTIEQDTRRMRRVSLFGDVTTVAGSGLLAGTDGIGTNAAFKQPFDLAVNDSGWFYVADQQGPKVRLVSPSFVVTTLSTTLGAPSYIALDPTGTFCLTSDWSANKIVKTDISSRATSVFATAPVSQGPAVLVITSAGNVYAGNTGPGTLIRLNSSGGLLATYSIHPNGLVLNPSNGHFFASVGHQVVVISPLGQVLQVVAGSTTSGSNDGWSFNARFNSPRQMTLDPRGVIYLAEPWNCKLRQLTCTPCPPSYFCFSGAPVSCPAGSYCPLSSINATLCAKGTFSNAGASNCTVCPAGTFASSTGSTSCQKCPGGHFCPSGTSSWARLNCGRGNYCPDGSGAPTPCPYQVPPSGGWGALQVQGPAFLVETAHCLNHCFWNFTSGDGMLSKC